MLKQVTNDLLKVNLNINTSDMSPIPPGLVLKSIHHHVFMPYIMGHNILIPTLKVQKSIYHSSKAISYDKNVAMCWF